MVWYRGSENSAEREGPPSVFVPRRCTGFGEKALGTLEPRPERPLVREFRELTVGGGDSPQRTREKPVSKRFPGLRLLRPCATSAPFHRCFSNDRSFACEPECATIWLITVSNQVPIRRQSGGDLLPLRWLSVGEQVPNSRRIRLRRPDRPRLRGGEFEREDPPSDGALSQGLCHTKPGWR